MLVAGCYEFLSRPDIAVCDSDVSFLTFKQHAITQPMQLCGRRQTAFVSPRSFRASRVAEILPVSQFDELGLVERTNKRTNASRNFGNRCRSTSL